MKKTSILRALRSILLGGGMLLAAAAFLAATNTSTAATAIASKDTYVQGATTNATSNFGTSTTLFSQDFSRVSSTLTFLSFDLSGYTPNTFTSATLQLTVGSGQTGSGYVFKIIGLKNNQNGDGWNESTLNYNGSGTVGLNYIASNSYISQDVNAAKTDLLGTATQGAANATVTFSAANLVSFLNADDNGMVTFLLAANGPYTGGPALQWYSREATTEARRPTLTFTVTADTTPPTVVTLSPADNATGVATGSNLVVTFSELIAIGTGNITLKNLTDNTQSTIAITSGSPQVSVAGSVLTINPTADLVAGEDYVIQIDGTAVKDSSGNLFAGIADDTTWNFTTDSTPPTVVTLSPADDATAVVTGGNLVVTFNEPIAIGTGNVTIRNLTDSTETTIAIDDDSQVAVAGSVLTINPTADLIVGKSYAIRIDGTAVKDSSGNLFAGIADDTTWNFTTDSTPPTVVTLSPADDATDGSPFSNLVVTFNEPIAVGTGNITLKNLTDNTQSTIAITDGSQVSVSGSVLTINPTADLVPDKDYAIQIDATAIKDSSGNFFAGISDDITWNFTTWVIVLFDDFATNPNVTTQWTKYSYNPTIPTTPAPVAWNSTNQDLDLSKTTTGAPGWMVGLYRTGSTRSATDPVTMTVKSLTMSGGSFGFLGLMITAVQQQGYIAAGATGDSYTLAMVQLSATTFRYEVRRTYQDGTSNFTLFTGPTTTFAGPYTLNIVRNGDHYDFKANGATLYSTSTPAAGDFYDTASKDSMIYYQVVFGGDRIMSARVDNFGIDTTPPTVVTLSPADDATDGSHIGNLVVTFNEPIAIGTGNITIKNLTDATQSTIAITDGSQVAVAGSVLTINPTADLVAGEDYVIQIDGTAVKDSSGNLFAGIADDTTWNFTTDSTPPTVVTLSPADDATAVVTGGNLVVTFNEPIAIGTGNVTIRNLTDSTEATIAIDDDSQVAVAGAVLTINPTADLVAGEDYAIQIDGTAVKNSSGYLFAGIADDTTWNFTTDSTPPTVVTLSPADDATDGSPSSNLVVTFNESIAVGTGNITLKNLTDNTQSTIAITDGSQVAVAGSVLTINPTADLAGSKSFAIQIDATAIKDSSGNFFAGISDDITWNFTTWVSVLFDNFATDPNIAGAWTKYSYNPTIPTTPAPVTWNSTNQDLDLSKTTTGFPGWMVGLYRAGATRSATEPVTMTVKSLTMSGGTYGFLGLMITAVQQQGYVAAGATGDSYTLAMVPDSATTFRYEVRRTYQDGISNFTLYIGPTTTFAGPYTLDIVRTGDHYDFKANGATLYSTSTPAAGDFYDTAAKDSMIYYQVVFGGDRIMSATVDNFGIAAAPSSGYASWQSANGATGQTLNLDHDGDGVPNGIEYFLGGPTGNTTGFTALPGVSNNSGILSITWTKAAGYTGTYGTDFRVETSETLTGAWTPETEAPSGSVTLTGNDVTYTFPTPPGAKKFARLVVTGP